MKILLSIPNPNDGTAYYRALPYYKLGHEITTHNPVEGFSLDEIYNVDVVFFQRPANQIQVTNIEICKKYRVPVIVDYDDYGFEIDEENPAFEFYFRDDKRACMKACLQLADTVTVSTQYLKECLLEIVPTANIVVIPNAVDDEKFSLEPSYHQREKVILLRGGGCFDDQTEVLTENGFKLFKDVTFDEKVATLNPKTNLIEYHKPINYIQEPYSGFLDSVSTEYLDYTVTPNHNMYVSRTRLKHNPEPLNFELVQHKDLYGQEFYCKKDGIWVGEDYEYFTIPSITIRKTVIPEKKIPLQDWLKLFGFWLADGWTSNDGSHQVGFALFKKNKNEIIALCEKNGYKLNHTKSNQIRICNKQLWSYLHQFGDATTKYIPSDILKLSSSNLLILLDYYLQGDGHTEVGGRVRAWTSSKALADSLMELSLKIGYSSSIVNRGKRGGGIVKGKRITTKHDGYQVSFIRNTSKLFLNPVVKPTRQKKKEYTGFVYCLEVPNNTLFVRRNGKPFWCGNSHGKDWEEYKDDIIKIMEEHPDYTLAVMGFHPEWLRQIKNVKYYRFTDIVTYFDTLVQLKPQLMIVPLQDTKFNRCKSNIAFLEGTLAGAGVIATDLPEFLVTGCFRINNLFEDVSVLLGNNKYSLLMYENAIGTIPRLSQINELRKDLIEKLTTPAKKYTPITLTHPKATDAEFLEYALSRGHTQDDLKYQEAHTKAVEYLFDYTNPKYVFEIGFGTGATLVEFLKRGVMAFGVEPNPESYRYFLDRYPMYAGMVSCEDVTKEGVQILGEKGDLLISIEVFEHINMPEQWWNEFIKDLSTKFKYCYFSSTPFSDPDSFMEFWGHCNVRRTSEWIDLFERNGWKFEKQPRILTDWDLIFRSEP